VSSITPPIFMMQITLNSKIRGWWRVGIKALEVGEYGEGKEVEGLWTAV